MRQPSEANLPDWCNNAMIDAAQGGDQSEEECSECDGAGIVDDEGPARCRTCAGTGTVLFSIRARRAQQREEAAEAKADQERDER